MGGTILFYVWSSIHRSTFTAASALVRLPDGFGGVGRLAVETCGGKAISESAMLLDISPGETN